MSLDTSTANRQVQKVAYQIEDLRAIHRGLTDYRTRLKNAWSAQEADILDHALSDLTSQISKLERQLERLQRDMERAIEDILEEEAEREAAANAILG